MCEYCNASDKERKRAICKGFEMAKRATITIRFTDELREAVETRAQKERRTFGDQAAYLIEKGIELLERDVVDLARGRAGISQINSSVFKQV